MSTALHKKLRITSDTAIRTVHAPSDYARPSAHCPLAPTITKAITKAHAFAHLFVMNKAELEKDIIKVVSTGAFEKLLAWLKNPSGR